MTGGNFDLHWFAFALHSFSPVLCLADDSVGLLLRNEL